MSDESKHKVEDYLQFSPLASAVPVASLIDAFVPPQFEVVSPGRWASQETFVTNAGREKVLQHIQRRAHELKTTLSFHDSFTSTSLASPVLPGEPLNVHLSKMLAKYRVTELPQESTSTAMPSTPAHPNAAFLRSTPGHLSPLAQRHSVPELSASTPIGLKADRRMSYAVEIESPIGKKVYDAHPHSQLKRALSSSDVPQTPKKTKIQHTGQGRSPQKRSPTKGDKEKLIVDLKTEQATVLEQLESCLSEIFEAEDSLEQDTSVNSGNSKSILFDQNKVERCLTGAATLKLLGLLRKSARIDVVPGLTKDSLVRVQRILARSVITFRATSLDSIQSETSAEGVAEDGSNIIDDVQLCLHSSSCILIIVHECSTQKDLYVEETLMSVVDSFKSVTEDLLIKWFSEALQSKSALSETTKKAVDTILQATIKLQKGLIRIFTRMEVTESIATRLVFTAVATIFAETPGRANTFCSHLLIESLKLAAITVLQRIFSHFVDQRQFIMDEILSSLSKLPLSRQGARQYKLSDGQSIRLVTALLLELVQSSCSSLREASVVTVAEKEGCLDQLGSNDTPSKDEIGVERDTVPASLKSYVKRNASANHTARYIINFLLDRSMKTIKTTTSEDAPFKALLDGFVEDFVNVLLLPEWPAAEAMLRWIANSMLALVDNPKQGAQVKVSAVDTLCQITCKIRATSLALRMPVMDDDVTRATEDWPCYDMSSGNISIQTNRLFTIQRIVCSDLVHHASDEFQARACLEYSVCQWIQLLVSRSENRRHGDNQESGAPLLKSAQDLADLLEKKDDRIWQSTLEYPASQALTHKAYLHSLSFSALFQMFEIVLPRLLSMMDHSQITLRTKTLRSFGRLSEIDPAVLSLKPVQNQIALRVSDNSPQVRDVAIDLLGRYISANPQSGSEYYPVLRERIVDTGLSVRKRVLKLCRELYTKNEDTTLRLDIACQLLYRLHDEEESIQELVFKSFESLWFSSLPVPLDTPISLALLSVKDKRELQARAEVIGSIACSTHEALVDSLRQLLSDIEEQIPESKGDIQMTLKLLGHSFSEDVINEHDEQKRLRSLVALRLLAQASPTAFSSNQMESLLPYLQYGPTKFEQNAPLYVASAYGSVLPQIASHSTQFLTDVQGASLSQLTKLPTKTLNEVVPTLCIVTKLLGDFSRPARTLKSCLTRLSSLRPNSAGENVAGDRQAVLLLHLIGLFGRYLTLDSHAVLQDVFQTASRDELVNMLVKGVLPFVQVPKDTNLGIVAKAALQSIGNISINCPRVFQMEDVLKHSDQIMSGSQAGAKKIVMDIYGEYLAVEQKKTDLLTKASVSTTQTKAQGKKQRNRNGDHATVDVGVLTGNTDKFLTDGISPSLMQRYLKQILGSMLGRDTTLAVSATQLIRSIVGQGLANPRNCVPTIIALQGSSEPRLREIAIQIHRDLYEKHESLIDSCYVEGVKMAFRYHMRMNNNQLQLVDQRATIDTLYEIVRASRKGRQRFLVALTKGLDINLDKLDSLLETDVKYALFLAHNIACLDYTTNEEVHIAIHAVDKILSTTGATFLQILEPEVVGVLQRDVQHGKVAAILTYVTSLRNQLKMVYNITDAKCLAFEPARLGNRSETRAASRQGGISLTPDWSMVHAPAGPQERIDTFTGMYNSEEQTEPSRVEDTRDVGTNLQEN